MTFFCKSFVPATPHVKALLNFNDACVGIGYVKVNIKLCQGYFYSNLRMIFRAEDVARNSELGNCGTCDKSALQNILSNKISFLDYILCGLEECLRKISLKYYTVSRFLNNTDNQIHAR